MTRWRDNEKEFAENRKKLQLTVPQTGLITGLQLSSQRHSAEPSAPIWQREPNPHCSLTHGPLLSKDGQLRGTDTRNGQNSKTDLDRLSFTIDDTIIVKVQPCQDQQQLGPKTTRAGYWTLPPNTKNRLPEHLPGMNFEMERSSLQAVTFITHSFGYLHTIQMFSSNLHKTCEKLLSAAHNYSR